jgi:inhibitor of KinA
VTLWALTPLGDRALRIQLGEGIDEATHRRVRAVFARLASRPVPGTIDIVPAYASVTVHYDPARLPNEESDSAATSAYERFAAAIHTTLDALTTETLPEPRVVEIPVSYGGELGPDLAEVARQHGLSEEEVVRLHSGASYLVYMLGFAPGFAYLGGLPEALVTPRRPEPRTAVPAGSVGIGGGQTGVYPLVSPGGWQLIGRTSIRLFDPRRDPPALLSVGDIVRFRAVAPNELPPA